MNKTDQTNIDPAMLHDRFTFTQPDTDQCNLIAQELEVPYPLAVILWQRGFHTPEDAKDFLSPQLASLPSPFLLKDMDKAVELVLIALREKWPIYILMKTEARELHQRRNCTCISNDGLLKNMQNARESR